MKPLQQQQARFELACMHQWNLTCVVFNAQGVYSPAILAATQQCLDDIPDELVKSVFTERLGAKIKKLQCLDTLTLEQRDIMIIDACQEAAEWVIPYWGGKLDMLGKVPKGA